ncbi:autotransporter outer membrane beta-barrel domain-containing protein [Legionella waltersii]|uniref:Autotransporter domain-containing protein n=1 Tax=Legionella waltersii TaxID=66969 RepID=A0A0W1A001_9GAMM|nr:autotransporter outer membrane beta-barrel domain-containing protein [Legionella waltersii]KTD74650.1 hypothetical protein Lwal_2691 [Legionella waltersii]SNV09028.1 Uncharacterised protein [Legionella waltersii]
MKASSYLVFSLLLLPCSMAYPGKYEHPKNINTSTDVTGEINQSTSTLKNITPEFLYSYVDFNFDSSIGTRFNRYNGFSNLYSVGADHINPFKDLIAGLYVLKVDTEVNSQLSLNPGSIIPAQQTIHNGTLYGHIKKPIGENFSIDVAGGYGQNQIKSVTTLNLNTPAQSYATSNYYNENWLANLNAIYNKQWGKLNTRAYVGVLYSQLNTGSYAVFMLNGGTPQATLPLTTKTTYVVEGGEISYKLNSTFSPFINAALIQVADYVNSRPIMAQPINGSLPQLIMDKNGFRVGGGLNFTHKQFTVRLEEKYYRAGNIFSSYQTLAALEYRFN